MASFTDAITQFNPYVAQLPVDAMVKVGMQKQAQYEQGVQKIQSQIDQVAGLDVLRDIDKNYLQTKLNDLGNDLKWHAASDFSNFQTVNAVGGMTKQISRDKNVQNAVSSTAWYRKQAQEMESAIKTGKSSQSNVWDFNDKANRYISSTNLEDTFSDRYIPYTDYQKKWTDVLGKLHSNLTQEDITNVMDANGNVDRSKLAAAMTRVKDEGVSATQIENAIRSSFNSNDLEQMKLDGRYQFRGASVEDLQGHYQKIYDSQVKGIDSRIKGLQGIVNSSGSNPKLKNKALTTIDELAQQKQDLKDGLRTRFDQIVADPEQAKGDIYKDAAVAEFANAFSWEHKTLEKLTNPELEAAHWEKDYGLKVAVEQRQKDEFSWKKYMDTENLGISKANLQLAIEKVHGTASGFTTYLGEDTQLKDPTTSMKATADEADLSANSIIQDYAKAMGKSVAAAESDFKKYMNGDKTAIDVTWRNNMDIAKDNRIKAQNINAAIDKTRAEVMADPAMKAKFAAVDNSIKGKTGLTLTVGGQTKTFSNKELYDYLIKEKKATSVNVSAYTSGSASVDINIDPRNFTNKELLLYNYIKGVKFGREVATGGKKVATDILSQYRDAVNSTENLNDQINASINKRLLPKAGKYIPSVANINVSNKDGATSRDAMEGVALSSLLKFNDPLGGTPGGSAELSHSQAIKAQDWLKGKDKDDIQYKKVMQGDKTYLMMAKGSDHVLIPLTMNEAGQLPKSKDEPSNEERDVKDAQQLGNGNTNVTSRPENSYFQTNKFNNVRSLSVTADLNADKTPGSGLNYINLNILTPSGWKNLQLDDNPMDVPTAIKRIGALTDMDIKLLFLANPNVPQSWKEEIKNL